MATDYVDQARVSRRTSLAELQSHSVDEGAERPSCSATTPRWWRPVLLCAKTISRPENACQHYIPRVPDHPTPGAATRPLVLMASHLPPRDCRPREKQTPNPSPSRSCPWGLPAAAQRAPLSWKHWQGAAKLRGERRKRIRWIYERRTSHMLNPQRGTQERNRETDRQRMKTAHILTLWPSPSVNWLPYISSFEVQTVRQEMATKTKSPFPIPGSRDCKLLNLPPETRRRRTFPIHHLWRNELLQCGLDLSWSWDADL